MSGATADWASRLRVVAWARGGWWGRYRLELEIIDRTEDLGFVCTMRSTTYLFGFIRLPIGGFECWKPCPTLSDAESALIELSEQMAPWLGRIVRRAVIDS